MIIFPVAKWQIFFFHIQLHNGVKGGPLIGVANDQSGHCVSQPTDKSTPWQNGPLTRVPHVQNHPLSMVPMFRIAHSQEYLPYVQTHKSGSLVKQTIAKIDIVLCHRIVHIVISLHCQLYFLYIPMHSASFSGNVYPDS